MFKLKLNLCIIVSSALRSLVGFVKMDEKPEVNENDSRKGEVNDKETKSKRYDPIKHIQNILVV